MFFAEKKISEERLHTFYKYGLIGCILFLALWLRKSLLPWVSVDMTTFYLPWYNFILSHGGFSALKFNFADLNVPYLYLIVIATHLPFSAITNLKLISIMFDMVLAGFTFLIVRKAYGPTLVPFLAACVVLFLPSIFINSSFWGETDSSYVSLSLGAIYFLLSKRYFWSFVFWGLAISVKLQAIFVFPVLLIVLLSGEVPLLYFLIIPAVYLILLIPALIAGRGFTDLLFIYVSQSNIYHCLTMNAPNVYQWLRPGCYFNQQLKQGGIILTVALVLIVSLVVLYSRKKLTPVRIIRLSFLFSLLLPFFLPTMHERYFYLADVFSIVYAFYMPRRFYLAMITQLTSFLSYMPFLFGNPTIPLPYVAFGPLFVVAIVVWDLIVDLYWRETVSQPTDPGANLPGRSERPATVDDEAADKIKARTNPALIS
ncbi:MAG TPA: hypothetical protein VFB60_05030 [Ktedonobacteraceae bacterium]|nr:hypothetical protein [Ktedonobacteraceae bacterium]